MGKELKRVIISSRAENTWKAYHRWVEIWFRWAAGARVKVHHPTPVGLAKFLAAIKSSKSVSTALAALKMFFSLKGLSPNPAASQMVSLVAAAARRKAKPVSRNSPFSRGQLSILLKYLLQRPSVPNLRLAAIINLCFVGCLRIDECLSLNLDSVELLENRLLLKLRKTKTDRKRDGQSITLAYTNSIFCPKRILLKYIEVAKMKVGQKGALFRKIEKEKRSSQTHNNRLTYMIARQNLQHTLKSCNIIGKYTWHSFRSGGASEALNLGASRKDVQDHCRWSSSEGMDPYIQKTLDQKMRISTLIAL